MTEACRLDVSTWRAAQQSGTSQAAVPASKIHKTTNESTNMTNRQWQQQRDSSLVDVEPTDSSNAAPKH